MSSTDSPKARDIVSLETLDENSNDESNRNSLASSPTNYYTESVVNDNDLEGYVDTGNFRFAHTANAFAQSSANKLRRGTASVTSSSSSSNRRFSGGILQSSNQTPSIFSFDNQSNRGDYADELGNKSCCIECGCFAVLIKCAAHCDMMLCENCCEKHLQLEINELIKIKNHLENSVVDLKKYLGAKKSQCQENIKSSQQIKKFINMTLQQIKRKVELELENKRDELFHSIFFVPDSTVQVNNSFGKIVLKSYDSNDTSDLADFNDTASYLNGMGSLDDDFNNLYNDSYSSNELSFLNNNLYANIDTSQVINQRNKFNTSGVNNMNQMNQTYQNRYNSNSNAAYNYDFNNTANPVSSLPTYHRRSNSANQRFHNSGLTQNNFGNNLAKSYNNSNYTFNESSSSASNRASSKASNYTASHLENKNFSYSDTNELPDSYDQVKSSVSNGKLLVEEENLDGEENQDAPSKPFVPGKILIAQQQQQQQQTQIQSKPSIVASNTPVNNQNNTTGSNSNNPQIKEIKVVHKTPGNRFNSSSSSQNGDSSSSNSSNSSKEGTPFSTTPTTVKPMHSATTVAEAATANTLSSTSSTSTSSSHQQTNLQKSFKQQILSQSPKLVNF